MTNKQKTVCDKYFEEMMRIRKAFVDYLVQLDSQTFDEVCNYCEKKDREQTQYMTQYTYGKVEEKLS